jgi:hypothetical protein
MEISWTDRVRNKVLQRVEEEGNFPHKVNCRKANLISQILHRKSHLNQAVEGTIEGRIEVMEGR